MSARSRRRRGFSVVEVLIAASLAIGLGAMVATAIASSSASSKNAITRAAAAQEVRQVNEIAARYVRGAVRSPKCLLPANGAQSFSSCLVPSDNGEMLLAASASSITLLVYPQGANALDKNAPAPEKVTLKAEQAADGSVSLYVYADPPSGGSFYDASYPATPTRLVRSVTLVPPKVAAVSGCTPPITSATFVFSFLDDAGSPVTGNFSESGVRARVAVIKFDPQVRVLVQGETCPRLISSPVFLTLPSRGFGR
jgi:type II secretory pathway pseudopilin PulG